MTEENLYYAEVPQLQGVWAQGKTSEQCRAELSDALPVLDGIDLNVTVIADPK